MDTQAGTGGVSAAQANGTGKVRAKGRGRKNKAQAVTLAVVRRALDAFLAVAPKVGELRQLVWQAGFIGIDEDTIQLYEQRQIELAVLLKRKWDREKYRAVRPITRKPISDEAFEQLVYDAVSRNASMTRAQVLEWAHRSYEIVWPDGIEGAD